MEEVGLVISSRDFLIYLDGLPSIRVNDIVESEQGVRGWITNLYQDRVEALVLDESKIAPGQLFKRLKNPLAVSVGEFLLGRVINPLGLPLDGKSKFPQPSSSNLEQLDQEARGVSSRRFIENKFISGITLLDTLIPIGKGQRQLLLGDAHSGKTDFLINLIANQKDTGVVCIYTSIGKSVSSIRFLIDSLSAVGSLAYTVIIAASSTEAAPLIYLTPQTAFMVAEHFQKKGKDVLLILDDMGNHAKIYREISLLSGKSPSRESYPADIFSTHAKLMERAGNFKDGGSITALPVIEINLADFTTFIPTNLMAMTDGHLMFKSSLHNQGQRPAIDISLSVSRVGGQTQGIVQNLLSGRIRQVLAQAEGLETVSRFSSELPFQTQLILRQKELIFELIKQESLTFIPNEVQVCLLALIFTSFLANKNAAFIQKYKMSLISAFSSDQTLSKIAKSATNLDSDEALVQALETAVPKLEMICK